MNRRLRSVLLALAALGITLLGIGWVLHEPRPAGRPGPAADALARRIESAVNVAAWEQTGAVSWRFPGRHHLWDRRRHLHRIRYEDGAEAFMDLTTKTGVVLQAGDRLPAAEESARLHKAWQHYINDQFWLNPFATLFAPGVQRALVPGDDGTESLLITFTQGGATPGDSYLLSVDAQGLPTAWKMWVSILPIGGVPASWEDWLVLPSGARISQTHRIGPVELSLTEIEGAASMDDLIPGPDPFLVLTSALGLKHPDRSRHLGSHKSDS